MNRDVIITCAVTGAGDTVGKHPAIPVTPAEITAAAIEAAKAGAAIAHIHVRNPKTGKPSRDPLLVLKFGKRIHQLASFGDRYGSDKSAGIELHFFIALALVGDKRNLNLGQLLLGSSFDGNLRFIARFCNAGHGQAQEQQSN